MRIHSGFDSIDDESNPEMVDEMDEEDGVREWQYAVIEDDISDAQCELHLANSDTVIQVSYLTPRLQL